MKPSHIILTLSFLAILATLNSCVTSRKLEYLRDKDKDTKAFKEAEYPDYRLKANDEIYIQIHSLDEAAANAFASSRQEISYAGSIQPYSASLLSNAIDKEGYLLMPVIGKILVQDKTLMEVIEILTDSLNHILNQPVVSVKLVNRYVSVLGEVRSPGHFAIAQNKLTIYDALSLAGDITDFGNRNNVTLIRNVDGENIRINLNLTNSEILASEYYNLRPNDIVYVKQVRQKFWNISQVPISLFLSAVTTALLIYSIIQP
jgi:polysaccharide export outer membrane protein